MNARADVNVRADGTKVSVAAGVVEIRGPGGVEQLAAGEDGQLAPKGEVEVAGRGPGYVDFAVGAGDSFAVHDPSPPTAVGFATGQICPEGAVVELVSKGATTRSRGTGVVSVLAPSGAHKYRVRCATAEGISNDVAANGGFTVMRDAGTARLPRTAPSTMVDTDGRSYTVLYQNILPKISVRWPKAPEGAYTLNVVSPGGGSQSVSTGAPKHSFASGALREGVHRFTFESGATRSKPTTVDIRFDNATPTATLTSPADRSFGPGGGVVVSGVVMEGWKIAAGGRELALDGQLRFSGEVSAPTSERALAIRFSHARRGVHYYLRRSAR
jgi:hypothetical protein